MKRSGTHMISNLILNSHNISLYKNDCGISGSILFEGIYKYDIYHNNKPIVYTDVDLRKIKDINEYDCIVLSCEDNSLKYFLDNSYDILIDDLNVLFNKYEIIFIQNIRNPKNILSSMIQSMWTDEKIENLININNLMLNDIYMFYDFDKEHFTNKSNVCAYVVSYDNILLDNSYLKSISDKLNLKYQSSIDALNTILPYGGGSSFTQTIKDINSHSYLYRYIQFENNLMYNRHIVNINYGLYKNIISLINSFHQSRMI